MHLPRSCAAGWSGEYSSAWLFPLPPRGERWNNRRRTASSRRERPTRRIICSPPPVTTCSRASDPVRRWVRCCAAIGSRSPAPANSTPIRSRPSACWARISFSTGFARPLRPHRPALPAPPRRPVLRLGRGQAASAAVITAGSSTRPAAASNSPTKTRPVRNRRRPAVTPRPIRSRNAPGSSLPISDRSRRRNCRSGSRSPGPTAFAKSCSPTCRATGFSARRIPSTRCISNGCTTIGAARLRGGEANAAPKHLKLKFEEFEHGFVYKRVREGQSEQDRYWTIGRVALWPNGFYLGSHFEWRVPVDDENTLSVAWFFVRVPKGREPYVQERVPTWMSPIKDENGRWITSHVINQDIVAWVGQGRIADRTKENLRSSDVGIAMMRKRFFEEIEAHRGGQGAGRHHPQRQRGGLHRAAEHGARTQHRGHPARRFRQGSDPAPAAQRIPPSLRPAAGGAARLSSRRWASPGRA